MIPSASRYSISLVWGMLSLPCRASLSVTQSTVRQFTPELWDCRTVVLRGAVPTLQSPTVHSPQYDSSPLNCGTVVLWCFGWAVPTLESPTVYSPQYDSSPPTCGTVVLWCLGGLSPISRVPQSTVHSTTVHTRTVGLSYCGVLVGCPHYGQSEKREKEERHERDDSDKREDA